MEDGRRLLGVLLYPGFEVLDVYGPIELWGNMPDAVRVVAVAADPNPVASGQGPSTVADYGYDNAPDLDLILVPGGVGVPDVLDDEPTLNWLRKSALKAEIVMSVCNGASILASAGLLDGRRATTNKMLWKQSTTRGKNVGWVKRARWVDDGDVVTSSGVSAGMDMTLAVIARLYGEETSRLLWTLAEYEPHGDPDWDPFADRAEQLQ